MYLNYIRSDKHDVENSVFQSEIVQKWFASLDYQEDKKPNEIKLYEI